MLEKRIYLLHGFKLIFQSSFRRYLYGPIALNLILYILAISVSVKYSSQSISEFPAWLSWLAWPLLLFIITTFSYFTFTFITNFIASFFYPYLAKKGLQHLFLLGSTDTGSDESTLSFILNTLKQTGKKILYFSSLALLTFIASLIPILNLISPLYWLIFAAWCLAFEFLSYSLDELNCDFASQRHYFKSHKYEVLLYGSTVMIGLTIPILNLLTPTAAVLAGCYLLKDKPLVHPKIGS